jgi:ribonuclease VapC
VNAERVVVDTSAIVAILRREPESEEMLAVLRSAEHKHMSVVSLVEAVMVLETRFGVGGTRELEAFVRRYKIVLEPVTVEQGHAALLAFWRFGKGMHPARLNFGDCFVYAIAKAISAPLLFKGDDFTQTDLVPAIS